MPSFEELDRQFTKLNVSIAPTPAPIVRKSRRTKKGAKTCYVK